MNKIIIELNEESARYGINNTEKPRLDLSHLPFNRFDLTFPTTSVGASREAMDETLMHSFEMMMRTNKKITMKDFALYKKEVMAAKFILKVKLSKTSIHAEFSSTQDGALFKFCIGENTKGIRVTMLCQHSNPVLADPSNSDYVVLLSADLLKLILTTLDYTLEPEKNIKEARKSFRPEVESKAIYKGNGNSKKYIGSTIYVVNNLEGLKPTEKKSYNRYADSWFVRGHWREYKSGKRVWIEPSTRGDKKSNTVSNYRITKLK